MNEREKLLRRIQQYCFALKELNLYLDTHPNCRRALALFSKYRTMKHKAEEEYVRRYGPLTAEQSDDDEHWAWTDEPWPWERS